MGGWMCISHSSTHTHTHTHTASIPLYVHPSMYMQHILVTSTLSHTRNLHTPPPPHTRNLHTLSHTRNLHPPPGVEVPQLDLSAAVGYTGASGYSVAPVEATQPSNEYEAEQYPTETRLSNIRQSTRLSNILRHLMRMHMRPGWTDMRQMKKNTL